MDFYGNNEESAMNREEKNSKIRSKRRHFRKMKQRRKINKKRKAEPMELTGTDLEIFKARFADLKARSLSVKFEETYSRAEKIFTAADCVKLGKHGAYNLIFNSEEIAQKIHRKLSKKSGVEVTYLYNNTEEIGDNVVVNPYLLAVNGLPKSGTKEDLKKVFPNASDIVAVPKKRDCLIYETKEDAAEDFRREDVKVNGAKLILLYRIMTNTPEQNYD